VSDGLRRQDDVERAELRIILHEVRDDVKEMKQDFKEDRAQHRETHKDLYQKIGGMNIKIAFGTGLVVAAWEAAKHAFWSVK